MRVALVTTMAAACAACSTNAPHQWPHSPVGRFADAWVRAMSTGDSLAIRQFTKEHPGAVPLSATQVDSSVADALPFTRDLGPLHLDRVTRSSDSAMTAVLRTDRAGYWKAEFVAPPRASTEQFQVNVSRAQSLPALGATGVSVPMTRTPSGRPIVMVSVNGSRPLRFVIDLGANVSIVTVAAARAILPAAQAAQAEKSGRFIFDSLSVGGAVYRSGVMRLDDLGQELDGLLGLDMFTDVLVTLDYPASAVRLSADSLPAANGRDVLDYSLPNPASPTIAFTLDGKAYHGVIDPGDNVALSFPDTMMRSLRWARPPVPGGRYSGPQLAEMRAHVGRNLGNLEIGSLVVTQPIIDLEKNDQNSDILIGQPTLAAVALSLDQTRQRLRLARRDTGSVRPPSLVVPGFKLKRVGDIRVVDDVIPATAAASAGLQPGDTVVTMNGQPLASLPDEALYRMLDRDSTFSLDVRRHGATRTVRFPRTRLVE